MISLRGYRPEDLDALHAVDAACFNEPFRFPRAALRRFLHNPYAHTAIAESPSGIIGFIIVDVEPAASPFGYVVTLDVLKAHRRGGVGAMLLREGERLAGCAGAASMRLHVYTGNGTAQTFYERMGYRQISMAQGFYGGERDGLLLERSF